MGESSVNLKVLYEGFRSTMLGRIEWSEVAQPSFGEVMVRSFTDQLPNGTYRAFYSPAEQQHFHRAMSLGEQDHKDWASNSKSAIDRFERDADFLLETVERVAPNHLACRLLVRYWTGVPDVCVGKTAWSYATGFNYYHLKDKADGKAVYLFLGGQDLWEVLALIPPLAENQPVRLEIVRRRGMPVGGVEGIVFAEGGLGFIADADARNRWTNHIQIIEHDLDADRPRYIISESAFAVDGIIQELGRQRLRAGHDMSGFSTEKQFDSATASQRAASFFLTFRNGVGANELRQLRPLIRRLRRIRNIVAHAESEKKLLVPLDPYTATPAYGALREFVRLMQAIHKRDRKVLLPDPQANRQQQGT